MSIETTFARGPKRKTQPSPTHIQHLDGIRAIALLGVLLFHFEVRRFVGGFVGVDVFLSLSGYLITRNIVTKLKAGTFSLREFYTRRFFRLYPAATATVFVAVFLAFAMFSSLVAEEVCRSAVASQLFVSNSFFHGISGYFDGSALLKPLLHTWSLSLEEQFYLLWAPLLVVVMLFFPTRRGLISVLSLLSFASLTAGAVYSTDSPNFAFFELPCRIYQFAAGAILAVYSIDTDYSHPSHDNLDASKPPIGVDSNAWENVPTSPVMHNTNRMNSSTKITVLSQFLSSLAFISLFILYMTIPRRSPPLRMIPVTICTIILIAIPDSFVATHILSSQPMQFVGRLSYSAYLVHWPIYVYLRFLMRALHQPVPSAFTLSILTMIFAWLLKTCVEDPVRFGNRRTRIVFMTFAVFTFIFSLFGVYTSGFEHIRNSEGYQAFLENELRSNNLTISGLDLCRNLKPIVKDRTGHATSVSCEIGDVPKGERSTFSFYGNSFMAHHTPAIHLIGKRRGMIFPVSYAHSCPFRASTMIDKIEDKGMLNCRKVLDYYWKDIRSLPNGTKVVVSTFWKFESPKEMREAIIPIGREIESLGKHFVLLAEPPGIDRSHQWIYFCRDLFSLPMGQAASQLLKGAGVGPDVCMAEVKKHGFRPGRERIWESEAFEQIFSKDLPNATLINLFKALCRNRTVGGSSQIRCRKPVGEPLSDHPFEVGYRRDMRHLQVVGSYWMSDLIEDLLFNNSELTMKK